MTRMVALLRAVNVGGRRLPMAELRALCGELGWTEVTTYIQSGNLVFSAKGGAAAVEAELEQAIQRRFDLAVPVIVRSARKWAVYAGETPFPKAARDEPSRLMLVVSKDPLRSDAAEVLQARATAGEKVKEAGNVLWIHFTEGAGSSKLTPSLIDRAIGSPATARNYNTVQKLQEMLTS